VLCFILNTIQDEVKHLAGFFVEFVMTADMQRLLAFFTPGFSALHPIIV
jgi:hypothetical protein